MRALENNAEQLEVPKASWADFIGWIKQWKNGKILLGTAGSWFLLDVAFYGEPHLYPYLQCDFANGSGLGLNNSIILQQIGYTHGEDVYKIFYNQAVGNLIISCAGAIPGYRFSVATVDTVGRKPI